MNRTVGYSVVVPPGYEASEKRRYPVVYWLHGGGGNECSSLFTAAWWENLYEANKAGEVIFLEQNHDILARNGTQFLLICGQEDTWEESAIDFNTALKARNIQSSLKTVPSVGHDIGKLIRTEVAAAALFQDRVFRQN